MSICQNHQAAHSLLLIKERLLKFENMSESPGMFVQNSPTRVSESVNVGGMVGFTSLVILTGPHAGG